MNVESETTPLEEENHLNPNPIISILIFVPGVTLKRSFDISFYYQPLHT